MIAHRAGPAESHDHAEAARVRGTQLGREEVLVAFEHPLLRLDGGERLMHVQVDAGHDAAGGDDAEGDGAAA